MCYPSSTMTSIVAPSSTSSSSLSASSSSSSENFVTSDDYSHLITVLESTATLSSPIPTKNNNNDTDTDTDTDTDNDVDMGIPNKRKSVRFADDDKTLTTMFFPTILSFEEVKSLWFDRNEIASFRYNNRKPVFESNCHTNDEATATTTTTTNRGLESFTLERQLHRHRTTQCILSAYKKGYSSGQITTISKRCNEWNKKIAYLQAYLDFLDVYQPSQSHQLRQMLSRPSYRVPPKFPFSLKRSSNSTSSRNNNKGMKRRSSPSNGSSKRPALPSRCS